MRKNRIWRIVIWSFVGLIFLWFIYAQFIKQPKVFIDVHKEVVQKETLYSEVSATGTINPIEMVDVGTQVSGQISEVLVDYNESVKKGQVLAKMDMRNLKSSLQESKANLEKAEINVEQTKRALEREKELFNHGYSSDLQLEQAQDAYNTAIATLKIAKIQLKKTSVNLGYADIVSPIDGVVISKNAEVGQTVAASFTTPTLFTIAKDLKEMKIEASVDEADIGQVKQYQDVIFTVDAYPDDEFKGVVAQVQLEPKVVQNVVTYNVIILIENSDLKLMPGMTATLIIQTEEQPSVKSVPNSALAFDPFGLDQKKLKKNKYMINKLNPPAENSVWVLKNKDFKEISVEVDFTNGIKSAIRGEIAVGDSVVTNCKISLEGESNGNLFMTNNDDE